MTKKILLTILAGVGVVFLTLGIFRGSGIYVDFDQYPMSRFEERMPMMNRGSDFYVNINGKEITKDTYNELSETEKIEFKKEFEKAKNFGSGIKNSVEKSFDEMDRFFDDNFNSMTREPMFYRGGRMMNDGFEIGFNISTIALVAIAGTIGYIIGRDRK